MVTMEDLEMVKRLHTAKDCDEYLSILDLEFPVYPESLDLRQFMKFDWNKLMAFGFDNESCNKIIHFTGQLERCRKNGIFNVAPKPAIRRPTADEMLEKTKTRREFSKLIDTMKKPSSEAIKRANNEGIGIFSAVYLGQDAMIRQLIEKDPSCVNKQNRYGWTPLHYVMCIGCSDAATILVQSKADLSISNNENVRPMVLGAKWGHRATVNNVCSALVACKGPVYVKKLLITADDQGRHPLHYAAESKQHVVCDVLLNFGADPNFRDNEGKSPTYLACKSGNLDTIKVLHKKWKGDIYLADKKKMTPFSVFPKDKKLLEDLKLVEDNHMEDH